MKNKMTTKARASKVSSTFVLLMLIFIMPLTASAHALKESSARVTLRDGQVEVRLWIDMNRWQTRLQDHQTWLLGDIKHIMPHGLSAKETQMFFASLLHKESSLILNNQAVSLKLLTISQAKNSADHHEYSELVLSAKHTLATVEQLNIRFPKSLGAVHASFVKPKYQMINAGSNAQVSFSTQKK